MLLYSTLRSIREPRAPPAGLASIIAGPQPSRRPSSSDSAPHEELRAGLLPPTPAGRSRQGGFAASRTAVQGPAAAVEALSPPPGWSGAPRIGASLAQLSAVVGGRKGLRPAGRQRGREAAKGVFQCGGGITPCRVGQDPRSGSGHCNSCEVPSPSARPCHWRGNSGRLRYP